MRYLAVDPGLTTGWAAWDGVSRPLATQANFHTTCEQLEDVCQTTRDELQLIIEKFTITPMTARQPQSCWSLYVIGVIKHLAIKYGLPALIEQTPSDAMTFATNSRLQQLGWWTPGKIHANDALRHMLLYATRTKLIDPRLLLD